MKPGHVNSAERHPPPIVSADSKTTTLRPVCAMAMAAARPFGPAPTTMASTFIGRCHKPSGYLDAIATFAIRLIERGICGILQPLDSCRPIVLRLEGCDPDRDRHGGITSPRLFGDVSE